MKKFLLLMLVLSTSLMFSACGNTAVEETNTIAIEETNDTTDTTEESTGGASNEVEPNLISEVSTNVETSGV